MEQQVPQVLVTCRKLDGQWEGVLIVRGDFERTYRGDDLATVISSAINTFLSLPYAENTRVQVVMNIVEPKQAE